MASPAYTFETDHKLKLLVTLESASVITPDGCDDLGSVIGGAITVRGDIIGPVSLGLYEESTLHSTYLVDRHTGEKQAEIYFDENDEDGPLIKTMGNPSPGGGQSDLRQIERLTDHTGSFFILPITNIPSILGVYGLVLYRALHEPSVFSRVGFFISKGISEEKRFAFKVTNESVAGTLVTIV